MNEVTTVMLENEMDLILANKQSMKLAEMAGLSISGQTTFATAVSEISRTAIDRTANATLSLNLSSKGERKEITAIIKDAPGNITDRQKEGYAYAKRLVSNMAVTHSETEIQVELKSSLPDHIRIDDQLIEKIRIQLNSNPSVSPYEEIKRKNKQLHELSEMLAKSEQRYKNLTDSLPLLIYTLDPDGKIQYGNKWLTDYTGKSIEELNATRWGDTLKGENELLFKQFIAEAAGKSPIRRERLLKDATDNSYRWHSGIATPIINDKGDVVSWNVFMADIHAQKTIEETLKDNHELKEIKNALEEKVVELNKSNRELEQFAYVASHDLQEPLRKIGFYTDMLRTKYRDKMPEETLDFFDNIVKSTRRMKTLIHDVLAYASIDANANAPTVVDLNELAGDVFNDLDLAIKEKEARITVDVLPHVLGNPVQLKQLFANILSNSLKYVRADVTPVITVSAVESGNDIVLSFRDNGIGFDTAYLDKMFHLFQRLHSKDRYSGTGIGLALCKKIVQSHGGAITAESKPGEGSVFIVSLPKLPNTSNA